MTSSGETTQKAGRGGLAIACAKIYFILVGFVQQVAFGKILGLEGYGALATALAAISILTNPITQASIQGVSREISSAPEEQRPFVLRRLLGAHGLFALILGLAFLRLAPWLAAALGAPHVTLSLQLLSSVLVSYGIYTPLVGALNGRRQFLSQAALDVTAATLRTVGLLGGAYLAKRGLLGPPLDGPSAASLGFAVAALGMVAIALFVVGWGRSGSGSGAWGGYLVFVAWLLVGQTLLNLLFQADGLLLRRFAAEAAQTAGLPVQAADPWVGAYRAAQLFGFLPYQLLMSVSFVLFPLLASAHAAGDETLVRQYVRSGVRLAILLAGLMASVLVAVPHGLIALAYSTQAADYGAEALRVLTLGLACLAVLGVMTAALNSLGGSLQSLLVTALALGLVVGLCFLWVPGEPLGPQLLVRCAVATSAGLLLATLLCATFLGRRAGGVAPATSLLRGLLAFAISAAVGSLLAGPGVVRTLGAALVTALGYLGILWITRELDATDRARLGALVGKPR